MRHHRTAALLSGVIALALAAPAAMASNSHANSHPNSHAIGHGRPVGTPAAPAHAGPTKITFKLRPNTVVLGGDLISTPTFVTHVGNSWEPLAAATFVVTVDGVGVATGVTDPNGQALVDYVGAVVGEHVMKVVYLGDAAHKKAQRAQGFTVDAVPLV